MGRIIRWIRKQFAKINTCFRGGEVNNQADEEDEYTDVWDEIIAQCDNNQAEPQQGGVVPVPHPSASETDVCISSEQTKELTDSKVVDATVESKGPTALIASIIDDLQKTCSKADDDSESLSTDEGTDSVIPERNLDKEMKLDCPTTLPSNEPAAADSATNSESWSASSDTETSSEEEEELDVIDMFLTEVPTPQNLGFDLVKTVEGKRQEVASDLLIVINKEHEFRVHQEILKEKSHYFEQRLSTTCRAFYATHVDSSLVEPEALYTALRLLYEGRCDKIRSMMNLRKTALFFGMDSVISKLQEVLENKQGTLENALANYVFAWDLKAELEKSQHPESDVVKEQVSVCGEYRATCQLDLTNGLVSIESSTVERGMQTSLDFLARKFEKLVMKSEYLEINFDQMQKLVQQDVLGARSEMVVFLAVLKWLDHKYLDREEYAEQLLSCVRFSCMTAEELLACFHPPILMGLMEMQEIKDMLHNALLYITARSLKQERLFKHLAQKTRVLLFKEKPLVLWEMDAYDPDCYSSPSSESCDDFEERCDRTVSTQNSARNVRITQLRKKTQVSKFLSHFGDD
ncbi:hypothetical protein JTE90_017178 [Oedothorax gibbosus]|uniref:BTB domain-containing protein n=1 Tax=Oedothorax gibbosus TaxID=931172 RepID=A0AAV6V9T4_9ARAC|nr:hypothetical protein JTE90_017178 [Oedothorax gibbosus]